MRKTSADKALGKAILGALITALIIKFLFFDIMIAEGHSMVPAIKPGAILLVNKLSYGIKRPGSGEYLVMWRTPGSGDVVVFYTPMGEIAVKRCGEILPGSEFYALGDNGLHSYDSRNYGPVPYKNIIGRVLGKE